MRIPAATPIDGSSTVVGVFVVTISPVASFSATTSVKVPPVSMPMRNARSMPGRAYQGRRTAQGLRYYA